MNSCIYLLKKKVVNFLHNIKGNSQFVNNWFLENMSGKYAFHALPVCAYFPVSTIHHDADSYWHNDYNGK